MITLFLNKRRLLSYFPFFVRHFAKTRKKQFINLVEQNWSPTRSTPHSQTMKDLLSSISFFSFLSFFSFFSFPFLSHFLTFTIVHSLANIRWLLCTFASSKYDTWRIGCKVSHSIWHSISISLSFSLSLSHTHTHTHTHILQLYNWRLRF